ncbi:MAG TPA: HAD family phosphatase [Gemmatimonadaceae bacterium]|nr:HAD family phosphatase [Gemmatimonadaceae bacterium]
MVDVALFELEGVLFDTRELRRAALREAMVAHGLNVPFDPEVVEGLTPRAAAQDSFVRAHAVWDHVILDLVALDAERSFSRQLATSGAVLQTGARELVDNAASRGRIAVVTRAGRADADLMLRLSGLESAFVVTVCSDNVIEPKPSPAGYQFALERIGRQRPIARSSVLALEDCREGIRAARAAGVRCVAVGALPAHIALEADALVESLAGHTLRSLDALSREGGERVQ